MGKDTSRRKKTKRAGRRSKRVKRETPRFPLYRQVGGATALELLTNLPGGNGSTNLAAWYDASDPNGTGTQPSNGDSITKWVDKSGNGRDLTKTAGTIYYRSSLTDSTPTFNKPAIDFRTNPGGIFLSSKQFNLSTTFSLYLVGVLKDSTKGDPWVNNFSYGTLFGHYPVTSPGTTKDYFPSSSVRNFLNMTLYPQRDSRYTQLERKGGSGGDPLRDPNPALGWLNYGDAPYILSVRADSSTKVMYRLYKMGVNGPYTRVNESSTVPSTTTPANITMGMSEAGNPIACYTSEIIYFQEFHTDTQAEIIESYLAWKWGLQTAAGGVLSSTSPYKTAQPRALSAGEIASAASAATASMAIASGQRASAATASMAIASGQRASAAIASAPRQYTSAYNMLTSLPNLAQWLDAYDPNGDGVLPAAGLEITRWVDKSGNRRDMVKGDSQTGKAYFRTSVSTAVPVFNKPAIDLSTEFKVTLYSSSAFPRSNKNTVYMVLIMAPSADKQMSSAYGTFFGHYDGTYADRGGFNIERSGYENKLTLITMNGNAQPRPYTSALNHDNKLAMIRYSHDGQTAFRLKIYIEGNSVNPANSSADNIWGNTTACSSNGCIPTTDAKTRIGINQGYSWPDTHISEIIYYQNFHTDQQAEPIEAYLAWKWGLQTGAGGVLPSSNPYSGTSSLKTITPEESAATASMAIASGQQASAQIASGQIASGQRASAQIASGQQASAQIASGQIASAAIASAAIASGQIASGQIASGQRASGQIASGQIASAAFASGQQYSGAFASGQIASAAYAIGQKESAAFASGQIASAAYASGQQYSGAFASGQQASGQQYSGAFASGQQYSGAFASGQQASGQQASSALGVKSLGQDPGSGKFLLRLQPL